MENWTDLKPLETDSLTEFAEELQPMVEFEAAKYGHETTLESQRYSTVAYVRTFADLRSISNAVNDIGEPLKPGEARHLLLPGSYTPFFLIHALKEITNLQIKNLHLVTLSHSAQNTIELLSMLDNGEVANCWLIASHVFRAKNPELYNPMADGLNDRKQHAMVCRTHVKVFLIEFSDGSKFTIEGSGNMRSCKSLEQAVIVRDDGLYHFHRRWIEGLFQTETN